MVEEWSRKELKFIAIKEQKHLNGSKKWLNLIEK